ncbi:DUF4942 domain-containing protein [Reinekea sp. G2M2-21]|uniref:DUF4942 domain-containing protein n=1 Tax=Reinekea sp. G2M2-21 TaxID=2788942 RepID=UPI0018A8FE76|nr:DUF4942 domain-containing protein [Reinekea sp. G2M2-21]
MNNTDNTSFIISSLPCTGDAILSELADNRERAELLVNRIAFALDELDGLLTRHCPVLEKAVPAGLVKKVKESLFGAYEVSFERDAFKKRTAKALNALFWESALTSSKLNALHTFHERENLIKDIQAGNCPAFDRDTLFSTVADQITNRWATFVGTVIETFDSLDRSMVTNDGIRFGNKIILSDMYQKDSWTTNHFSDSEDRFTDLYRIFMVLDSKDPTSVYKAGHLIKEARAWEQDDDWKDLEYFRVKKFDNGNLHVVFHNVDFVERLNLIIAKHGEHLLGKRNAKASKGVQ